MEPSLGPVMAILLTLLALSSIVFFIFLVGKLFGKFRKVQWWVVVILGVLSCTYIVFSTLSVQRQSKLPETSDSSIGVVRSIDENEMLEAVNRARIVSKVEQLVLSEVLKRSALDKCNDMASRGYWDHNTPDGEPFWTFIEKYHVFSEEGENLGRGYQDADEATKAFMESPSHRENLLSAKYKYVGFGICTSQSGEPLLVQHLGG